MLSVQWPHLKDGSQRPLVQQLGYDEQARLLTLGEATQIEEETAYDADDRVLLVQWPHLVDSGRPQVQQYTYDEQARLLKVEQGYGTWNGTETKWTFTQYSSFHDFRLDEPGNWAEHKDGAGASFVSPTIAKDNAYTAWPVSGGSTLSFVLDDTGRFLYERPVSGGGKYLYKHDGLGRLVSAQRIGVPGKTDLTTTYGYTADGRLAWRKEGTASREWLIYDGSQAVVQTTDSALSWTHVWAGSRLVRTTKHPAGTVYHPHQDRLGSIVVVTRSGGPDRALYDPYGRLVAAFSTITNDTFAVPYGYAGARWEATAGLYQMGARWYDPELGRFLEQDPIGEAGGLNLYAYVGSSPTLWVDPTGLAREGAPGLGTPGGGSGNCMTQMNWSFSGGSTSDSLTGGSGGWIDFSFRHQVSYYGVSKDKLEFDTGKSRDEGRAMIGVEEANATAEEGGRAEGVDGIVSRLITGAIPPHFHDDLLLPRIADRPDTQPRKCPQADIPLDGEPTLDLNTVPQSVQDEASSISGITSETGEEVGVRFNRVHRGPLSKDEVTVQKPDAEKLAVPGNLDNPPPPGTTHLYWVHSHPPDGLSPAVSAGDFATAARKDKAYAQVPNRSHYVAERVPDGRTVLIQYSANCSYSWNFVR